MYSVIPYQSSFSRVPNHRENYTNFVVNHRKMSINKSNYTHLSKGEASKITLAFVLYLCKSVNIFVCESGPYAGS